MTAALRSPPPKSPINPALPARPNVTPSYILFADTLPHPLWPSPAEPSFIRIRAPRRRPRRPDRARARVVADPWQQRAGNLAVLSDLAAQGARAARGHDARALDALLDRIRVTILEAIELSNTNEVFAKKGYG